MIFTQHYLACLSQASYLIGDETTGRAVVVDPRRDVDVYLDEAHAHGLAIERVIETHVHADFLSGHLELAKRTGAVISYGSGARLEFPAELLDDGQRISLGDVTLEVMATPGHTPESICIIVYEHPDDAVPYGVLTGDTLFVGDVGRPDLLASADPAADRRGPRPAAVPLLARPPVATAGRDTSLPGTWGRVLVRQATVHRDELDARVQRAVNYALQPMSEDAFVAAVTEGQPFRPHYFEFDAQRNRELRPLLDDDPPPQLTLDEVLQRHAAGAVLLDCREPADFAAGHVHGAVNIGLQGRFAEWAGDVLSPRRDIVLVGDPAAATEAKLRLARVGYDRVVGQLADPAASFATHPDIVEVSSRLTAEQLAAVVEERSDVQLIDLRDPAETQDTGLPDARLVPLAALTESLDDLDRAAPVVVYCASGYRSSIAASVLVAAGFADVSDLRGGFAAWESACAR